MLRIHIFEVVHIDYFLEVAEHFVDVFGMFVQVVGVDEDVVKIDNNRYIEHISEDLVHEALESCGCVTQVERHDEEFKGTIAGAEGGFPFVTLCNADEIVGASEVKLGEAFSYVEAVKKVGN
jgi:hypothetical protein